MRLLAAVLAASSMLAGCVADEPIVPTDDDGPDVEPGPDPEPIDAAFAPAAFDGVLAASVGTPVFAANPASDADDFLFAFEPPANATSATATMTWNATQSTAQNLRLIVEKEDGTLVAEGVGASPLVVTFEMSEDAKLQTRTFAASGSLAKDQPFHVDVTYA